MIEKTHLNLYMTFGLHIKKSHVVLNFNVKLYNILNMKDF